MLATECKQNKGRGVFGIGLGMLVLLLSTLVSAGAVLASPPIGDKDQQPTIGNEPNCGPNWEVVPGATPGTTNGLHDIEALSSNDVWAMGSYYDDVTTNGILFEHWNGSQWTQLSDDPPPGVDRPHFAAFAVVSANDIWAVGNQELNGSQVGLVAHWDGSAWAEVPSPHPGGISRLGAVEAVSANDIWAVGEYQVVNQLNTFILHWDGNYWAQVPSPSPGASNQLWALSAISATDIWAVGNYFTQAPDLGHTLTLHWNGSEWTQVPSPNPGTGFENRLSAVEGVSSNDVWAMGSYYNDVTTSGGLLIVRWDGSQWTQLVVSMPGTYVSDLAAVSANDVWAVGSNWGVFSGTTAILHWNGTYWAQVPAPSPGAFLNHLDAVTVVSARDVWAVGRYIDVDMGPERALIERYNPCDATATPVPTATYTPVPPTATPTACPGFTDVPPDNTFYPYVTCLVNRGIVSGYSDCTFRPNNPVTRGQLSKIVSNSAGFNEPPGVQMFEDVPPGSTFYEWVQRLASRGYISGYPCGGAGEPCGPANLPYFRPNAGATRGQLTKIVSNAAGFTTTIPPTQYTFADVPPDSTFWMYIERLLVNRPGVMSGYQCGGPGEPCDSENRSYFRPNNPLTRGQTSKIVANTFFPGCQTPSRK